MALGTCLVSDTGKLQHHNDGHFLLLTSQTRKAGSMVGVILAVSHSSQLEEQLHKEQSKTASVSHLLWLFCSVLIPGD